MNLKQQAISFDKSIGTKLLRVVFSIYFVVTVIVTLGQLIYEYRNVKGLVFRDLVNTQITHESGFAKALWEFRTDQAQSILIGLDKVETIKGVKIYQKSNDQENIFASIGTIAVDGSTIKETVTETGSKINYVSFNKDGKQHKMYEYQFPIHFIDPIKNDKNIVGYGAIYSDESVVVNRVKYGFFLIIINSIIKTIALWTIFLIVVRKMVSKPLLNLTSAIESVNTKNLQTDASIKDTVSMIAKRNDEVGLLSNKFHQMMLAIIDSTNKIKDLNQNLEKKVIEKTKNIGVLLNNMRLGVLTIMEDGKIHNEYSRYTSYILDRTNITGKDFTQVIRRFRKHSSLN